MQTRKQTSIVAVVTGLLAASAQGLAPEPHFHNQATAKVDFIQRDVGWPFEYRDLDLCAIPVHLEVGYYVEVGWPIEKRKFKYRKRVYRDPNDIVVGDDWEKWRFDLRQVSCGDIDRDTETDWPCFLDCEEIKIRANFDVKLSTRLYKTSNLIEEWEAYFDGTDVVTGSGEWETVKICIIAWRARLLKEMGAAKVQVGKLIVTVKPNV